MTYRYYITLKGESKRLISKIADGKIIKRFDKTGVARSGEDIVCPHFLELKWAYGCPLQCAYCYLQGTLRFQPNKKSPKGRRIDEVQEAIKRFINEAKEPEILNSGELADSLMFEGGKYSLSKNIIPLFRGTPHKVLLVTKLDKIEGLLGMDEDLKKNVIASFSINSEPVASRWEVGVPSPLRRIEAAHRLHEAGFEVRIRLDPIVPYPESKWLKCYYSILDRIFEKFTPERITLGSLRGLTSTINNSRDRSWTVYLKERSKWGKRIPFEQRFDIFADIIDYLRERWNYENVALCKEPVMMWEALGMDWKSCRCNCTW
ncbi:MAG: hypothetical protein H5T34_08115 [Candidatus Methanomethyliales bacterium]|nr:hypothetical protein [Candidatus Methanomethylicales archaeon]